MGRELSIVRVMSYKPFALYDMCCRFSQSMDSTITFEMFDKGFGSSHSYGTVQKTVSELLAGTRLGMLHSVNHLPTSANDTSTYRHQLSSWRCNSFH